MTLCLKLRNQVTGTVYDVSTLSDLFELREQLELSGYASQFTIPLKSAWGGNVLTATPVAGMEVVFGDDAGFPGFPDPWDYYFVGKIMTPVPTDTPYGLLYSLECIDFTHELHMPIFRGERTAANDQAFIVDLISNQAHLPGTWNGVDLVGGPYITYPAGSVQPLRGKVIDILEQVAADSGYAATPVAPRRFYASGRWTNPAVLTSGITRYLSYFSTNDLPLDFTPLTDDPTGNVDLAADTFPASTRLSSTTLGRADTSHPWLPLVGVWGVHSTSTGYLPSPSGSDVNVAVIQVGKDDAYVEAKMTVNQAGAGVVGRVRSEGGGTYSGWLLANTITGYTLYKFIANGTTPVFFDGSISPANNDVLRLDFSGDTIRVYTNGVLRQTLIDSYHNTETWFGIGASTSATTARWDNFHVNGPHGALYYTGWGWTPDASGMGNVKLVIGPGADPEPVEWTNLVNAEEDGGTLYKAEEGNAWDSGGISVQEIGEEGGEIVFSIDEYPIASDTVSRPDNPTLVGELETGQDWVRFPGSTATWGVVDGRIYCSALTGSTPRVLYANFGASTCVFQVRVPAIVTGGRVLVFRFTDEANYWYIQANASTYTLHKRVAGVDSAAQATLAAAPVANDTLKVSLEARFIRFYRNGAGPSFNIEDAFNEEAVNHGIGIVAGGLAARWDDVKVWTTYHDKFISLDTVDTNQSYTDGQFGMLFKASRVMDITQNGSPLLAGTTYALGDEFRIAMALIPATPPRFDVLYYKRAAAATVWTLLYTSLVHPDPQVTPFHVDAAFYHTGAAWSTLTIEKYSGAIYREETSIALYGAWPAGDVTQDDSLDSITKRRNQAHSYFGTNGLPHNTFTQMTLHRYRGGTRVLYNNSRLNISNSLRSIVRVEVDRSNHSRTTPEYIVTLDNPPKYFGERGRALHLAGGPDNPVVPPRPSNFRAGTCRNDLATLRPQPLVQQEFLWDVPDSSVQFIEVLLGGMTSQPVLRFSAGAGHGSATLPAGTVYLVRARFRPYRGDPGPWSESFTLTTCARLRPGPPTGLTVTRIGVVGQSGAALLSFVPPSPVPYRFRLRWYPNDVGPVAAGQLTEFIPGALTTWIVDHGILPGKTYIFELWSQAEDGTESLKFATATGVFAAKVFLKLPNGDFSEIDQANPVANQPRWWALTNTGATVPFVDTSKALAGLTALKVPLTGGGDTTTAVSSQVGFINPTTQEIIDKYSARVRIAYYADNASANIRARILWYDNAGAPVTPARTVIPLQAPAAAKNVVIENNYVGPAGTVRGVLELYAEGIASIANNIWFTGIILEDAIPPAAIKKFGVGSSQLADFTGIHNPQFADPSNEAPADADTPPQPADWTQGAATDGATGERILDANLFGTTALELQLPGVVDAFVPYSSEPVTMPNVDLESIQIKIKIAQEADTTDGVLRIYYLWLDDTGGAIGGPALVYNDAPTVDGQVIKAKLIPAAHTVKRQLFIDATQTTTTPNNIRLVIISEGIALTEDDLEGFGPEGVWDAVGVNSAGLVIAGYKFVTSDGGVVIADGDLVYVRMG